MGSASTVNRFLSTFVVPMAAGGRVEVHGVLGPGILDDFTRPRMMDGTAVAQATTALHAALSRLGPARELPVVPANVLGLAAVWHNLLALTHPDASRRKRLRRRVRAWCESMLTAVSWPRTASDVALRFAALARLPDIGRVDTNVTFWAGSASFLGVAPPSRLLKWRSVRRVRETRIRVPLYDLLQQLDAPNPDESLLDVLRAAIQATPLLDLALCARPAPMTFGWSPALLNSMGDLPLRGAAIRAVLDDRFASTQRAEDQRGSRIAALERATVAAVEVLTPTSARALVQFHLELLVTDSIGRATPAPEHPLAWDAVARLGAARTAQLLGLDLDDTESALGLSTRTRSPAKEAPSLALLSRAGLAEVAS